MESFLPPQLLEILAAGGNAGTWVAVYILHRIHLDLVNVKGDMSKVKGRMDVLERLIGSKAGK